MSNETCPHGNTESCDQCTANLEQFLETVVALVGGACADAGVEFSRRVLRDDEMCTHGSLAKSCQVCELTRQRDAAVAEYVGIVDAIDALGCPDDIATVDWVESLVRERDELRTKLTEAEVRAHATDTEMLSEVAGQIERSRALRARLDADYPDTPALGKRRAAGPLVCAEHWITYDGCQVCKLARERDELRTALENMTSSKACLYFGDGWCSAHDCKIERRPCPHGVARKLLGWDK